MDSEASPNPGSFNGDFGPLSTPAGLSSRRGTKENRSFKKSNKNKFDVHLLMMKRPQQVNFSTLKNQRMRYKEIEA